MEKEQEDSKRHDFIMRVLQTLVLSAVLCITVYVIWLNDKRYEDIMSKEITGYDMLQDITKEDIRFRTDDYDERDGQDGCTYEEFDRLAELNHTYHIDYIEKAGFKRSVSAPIRVVNIAQLPRGMYKLKITGKRIFKWVDILPKETGYFYNKGSGE